MSEAIMVTSARTEELNAETALLILRLPVPELQGIEHVLWAYLRQLPTSPITGDLRRT